MEKIEKPWGEYTDFYRSDKVVFKTITVKPHSQLSLQSHTSRGEIWVLVEGEAYISNGIAKHKLNILRPIMINRLSKHRLINESDFTCTIAELQFGECNEEDILRFEDDYGRS